MANPEQALLAQLRNIQDRLGRDLPTLAAEIAASGKVKHGDIRSWAMETYGLGYGDANTLAHQVSGGKGAPADAEDALGEIYSGTKAHHRAVHDALVAAIAGWGDYEAVPKKAYVAFRRKKQFAMLGPKNAAKAELGINLKEDFASERIVAQKPGGMCQYAVLLEKPAEIDSEVLAVLRRSFDAAG